MSKNQKTEWDLSLLYKGAHDPQIEIDIQNVEKANIAFEKKFKNVDFTSTPQKLAKALEYSTKIREQFSTVSGTWYFGLRKDLDGKDTVSSALATKYNQRLTHSYNRLTFFHLAIGKIPKNKQAVYLKHKLLAPYAYSLKKIFLEGQYRLSEAEEQLEDLLSQPAYTMWVDGQEKLLNEQTVVSEGKTVSLPEASAKLHQLPKKKRHDLYKKIIQAQKNISHFAEAEINAIVNFKKVLDERRGFLKPYSSRVLANENDEESIEVLMDLITKHFHLSHRFYALHTRLLKEKKITVADRSTKIGEIQRQFDFHSSVAIVKKAIGKVNPQFSSLLESFLEKGQIDVYPKKGKAGGAYCSGHALLPTFILLNHVSSIGSVETFAHEMGHAIHTELSKKQPPQYRRYSTATAEVASTFFEQVTIDELEKDLSDKEKIIFYHNRLLGDISTIFRQTAFFNFELELHNRIRKEGELSKQDIAKLMAKHLKSYLGKSVEVLDDDGYFFVNLSHIRMFFYVYTYAYGQLVSRALFEKWKADPSYAKSIEQFLTAGKSMSPKDIFKKIGINTADPAFFKAGLMSIEKDIAKLESLTRKKT